MAEGGFISPRTFQQRLERRGRNVKVATVWRWCREKVIDARAIGGEWLIRESEVDRVMDVGTRRSRANLRQVARS